MTVEYREGFAAPLSTDAPFNRGHKVGTREAEREWNADLFHIYVDGGSLAVLRSSGEGELVFACSPAEWSTYELMDYTK